MTVNEKPSLWPEGSKHLLESESKKIAIVGQRKVPGGREGPVTTFTEKLSACLAEAGYCIVSGFARGIDRAAHRGALSVRNGTTIMVLMEGLPIGEEGRKKLLARGTRDNDSAIPCPEEGDQRNEEEKLASYKGRYLFYSKFEDEDKPKYGKKDKPEYWEIGERGMERNQHVVDMSDALIVICSGPKGKGPEGPEKTKEKRSGTYDAAKKALEKIDVFVLSPKASCFKGEGVSVPKGNDALLRLQLTLPGKKAEKFDSAEDLLKKLSGLLV